MHGECARGAQGPELCCACSRSVRGVPMLAHPAPGAAGRGRLDGGGWAAQGRVPEPERCAQVEEKRAVSQDLELWIGRAGAEGGYSLLARAGRLVQEIQVTTALGSEDMKAAIQRVLRRLV